MPTDPNRVKEIFLEAVEQPDEAARLAYLIRLKPGSYRVEARKDGKVVSQELVTVTRNGRQVVRVSREAQPAIAEAAKPVQAATAWERPVAAMKAAEQVKAVAARMSDLTPLKDLSLEAIGVTPRGITARGLDVLRNMKSLSTINIDYNPGWPTAEFWARYDKRGLQVNRIAAVFGECQDLDPIGKGEDGQSTASLTKTWPRVLCVRGVCPIPADLEVL